MEQEPKKITDRQIYETSIGPVCMSKIEYAMYQEEMVKRIEKLHIYVDADACPVVRIVEKIAEKYTIPVTLLCDTNHVLQSNYSEVIVVGAGADAVDYKLISILSQGRYCCITGLWGGGNGTWKRSLCNPSVREMVMVHK